MSRPPESSSFFLHRMNDMFDTVDGTNPAPLRMPEMLVLSQYQDVFGHPKWCRIFSINRMFNFFWGFLLI